MPRKSDTQGSLFEDDYLLRTLGHVAQSADVAVTELVANAWDAGASRVQITIPENYDGDLVVADNGCGMTRVQFRERWMRLAYNRMARQGPLAESVPSLKTGGKPRRAYGRNGVGRHGMLCFANTYLVRTHRSGEGSLFRVSTTAGKQPFAATLVEELKAADHGTTLIAKVNRNLPQAERIRRVISARFMHDPEFEILVNGVSLPLTEHEGLVYRGRMTIDDVELEVFIIDSDRTARTTQQHGVAFWVGNRLVGEPSWMIAGRPLADGRTILARRHTVVLRTSQLYDDVLPDWTGFRTSERMTAILDAVVARLSTILRSLASERRKEIAEAALKEHRHELIQLPKLARLEVAEFVEEVTQAQPMAAPDALSTAVRAVINLERSRSGQALLQKLSALSDGDIDGLNHLLETWTVRDALTVLDEIDRRLAVVEALDRFSRDANTDELATLHPLVAQARWLFSPEFDSPLYSSNVTIRRAVEKVFGEVKSKDAFVNYRNRPDLVVLADGSTLCAVASEDIAPGNSLSQLRRVLLIELKKGGFRITRKEVNQASDYVEDLLHCGLLDGAPFVNAYVVGDQVDDKVEGVRIIGSQPERGRIEVATYGRLVRTAGQRLFRLRDELSDRYDTLESMQVLERAIQPLQQLELNDVTTKSA